MWCSTPISCIAGAAGSSCSVRPRNAIRATIGRIPASRNYVQHLRLWYAQSHPDEDFAETFAVWLRPRSNWRTRYAGWPALKKLEYVDELMGEIAGKRPLLTQSGKGRSAQQAHRDARRLLQEEARLYLVDPPQDL